MVWALLLLAHFVADYPLQPFWLVKQKRYAWAVAVHSVIHLFVAFTLLWSSARALWPYVLLLGVIHFVIDWAKNMIWVVRPRWVVWPYVGDQLLHYLSIAWIASLIARYVDPQLLPAASPWPLYLAGYLIVTYSWFITERVLAYADPEYQADVNLTMWPRMVVRAGMFTVLMGITATWPMFALAAALPSRQNSLMEKYLGRWLAIDFLVSLVVTVFIRIAS